MPKRPIYVNTIFDSLISYSLEKLKELFVMLWCSIFNLIYETFFKLT